MGEEKRRGEEGKWVGGRLARKKGRKEERKREKKKLK